MYSGRAEPMTEPYQRGFGGRLKMTVGVSYDTNWYEPSLRLLAAIVEIKGPSSASLCVAISRSVSIVQSWDGYEQDTRRLLKSSSFFRIARWAADVDTPLLQPSLVDLFDPVSLFLLFRRGHMTAAFDQISMAHDIRIRFAGRQTCLLIGT
jgi:hypothetical protein